MKKRLALIVVVVLGAVAAPAASAASADGDQPAQRVDTNTVVGPSGETLSGGLGAVYW
jgi:hypothetical protein